MSTEFKLPELGENVAGGDVLRVLVAPGDTVTVEQPVLELETDKATVEVPSSVSGKVTEVRVKTGEKVKVGQVVLVVEGDGGQAAASSPPAAQAAADADAGGIADAGGATRSTVPADATPEYVEEVADEEPLFAEGESAAAAGTMPDASSEEPAAEAAASPEPEPESSEPALVEFTLPELGENVAGGDVVHILVKVGDRIKAEQPVLELETDKATVEVPSSVAGTVKEIRVATGTKVKVGEPVLLVETAGRATPKAAAVRFAQVRAAAPSQRAAAPTADKPGMLEDALAEARAESQSRAARGAVVDIAFARASAPDQKQPPAPPAPAAPSVRRTARELGVDINQVTGTGPGGRISVDDVKAYVKKAMLAGPRLVEAPPVAGPAAAPPLPDFSKWGPVERKPMRAVRRTTAERLSTAWTQVPHVTQFDVADITALEEMRKQFGKRVESAGGKLTVTAVALKVVAAAMKVFPQFNTAVDMASGEIVQKGYCHIGIAVDTDRGLLVPVIRDVDRKNVREISVELAQASEKARTGKTALEEMQGGCFTITNLGGIGGTHFTPIVNYPEVAILGLSRARMEPVWQDEGFAPRLMLPLSLSYDHRAIDGADGIRFLRWVAEALEQPFLLSLEG